MRYLFLPLLLALLLAPPAMAARKDLDFERVFAMLQNLKEDPDIAPYLQADAMERIDDALELLKNRGGRGMSPHYAYLVEKNIEIARAEASEIWAREMARTYVREREQLLLDIRAAEAREARREAEKAIMQSAAAAEEARRAMREAELARLERDKALKEARAAKEEAEQARRLAEARSRQAELAKQEAELALAEIEDLQGRLKSMEARQTDRGLVLTLGDVLFDTGQAQLREEGSSEIAKVLDFVNKYPDRLIRVEGHTDSVGDAEYNQQLSLARADAVKATLVNYGIADSRIQTLGFGESRPVGDNSTEQGRQENRRVEIVILK